MTDEALEVASEAIDELREAVRDALVEDLGGSLEAYDVIRQPVADGRE